MTPYTQTALAVAENNWVGNCFQFAVASLLDVDPETLPAQIECNKFETGPDGKRGKEIPSPHYPTRIRAWLFEHHGLTLIDTHMPAEAYASLRVADPGWHLISGCTVRTAATGNTHLVVGRYGEVVWDPHPSRAGLLKEGQRWMLVVPYPKEWRSTDWRPWGLCFCPQCVEVRKVMAL